MNRMGGHLYLREMERALVAEELAEPATTTVHWTLWCAVLAVTCAMVGVHWDIAWQMSCFVRSHFTVGREKCD